MTDLERAYRDGKVDTKLDEHSAHLAAINGANERTALALDRISRTTDRLADQVTSILTTLPRLEAMASRVAASEEIEAAIRQKIADDRSFWDRNRSVVAWALGIVAVVTATSTQWLKAFGVG